MVFVDVTPPRREEVNMRIDRGKAGKAADSERLTLDLIRAGGEVMVTLMFDLFTTIWTTACVPIQWGQSIIVVLCKGSKGFLDVANYRPINLISVMLKLMERLLLI
jgi:hypothetical protein